MSTLAEIEQAIEHLPAPEQEELFVFLAQKVKKPGAAGSVEDPFAAVIGAFAGAQEATGRKAEDFRALQEWMARRAAGRAGRRWSPEELTDAARQMVEEPDPARAQVLWEEIAKGFYGGANA